MNVRKRRNQTCSELLASLTTINVGNSVEMRNEELSKELERQKEVSAEFLQRAIRAEEALMEAEKKLHNTVSASDHARLERAFVELSSQLDRVSSRETRLKTEMRLQREKMHNMEPFILPTSLDDWDKCLEQLKVNLEEQKEEQKKEEYFG